MKVTIKGYVTYSDPVWTDEPAYSFYTFDPSEYSNLVIVMQHSFEVEVPDDFDPRPGQIATLKAQKERVQAEFAKKLTDIDTQINRLLAIEA
jgi:hypothetical protein